MTGLKTLISDVPDGFGASVAQRLTVRLLGGVEQDKTVRGARRRGRAGEGGRKAALAACLVGVRFFFLRVGGSGLDPDDVVEGCDARDRPRPAPQALRDGKAGGSGVLFRASRRG